MNLEELAKWLEEWSQSPLLTNHRPSLKAAAAACRELIDKRRAITECDFIVDDDIDLTEATDAALAAIPK